MNETLFISWSSLRTHEECKQKGMLKRRGKRNTLSDTRGFFPGTVVDRVTRDWLMNDPENNLGAMVDMVEPIIEREKTLISEKGEVMRWKDPGDKDTVIKDCIQAVKIIEKDLIEKVLPFDYQPDFGFKAPLLLPHPDGSTEMVILNGFMDILVHDPAKDSWRVYDVKMTRDESYWRKTVGQLSFYDLVCLVLFGQVTDEVALLQPMCKQTVKDYPLTDNIRSQLAARITRMADEVWRENYTPKVGMANCAYCEVKHACTKFKPVNDGKNKRMTLI